MFLQFGFIHAATFAGYFGGLFHFDFCYDAIMEAEVKWVTACSLSNNYSFAVPNLFHLKWNV